MVVNNKSENNKNKFDKKGFKDKIRYDKMPPLREIRSLRERVQDSEYKLPTFMNPDSGQDTEIKREYLSTFCKYCKMHNHNISECQKLKYNQKKKLRKTLRGQSK